MRFTPNAAKSGKMNVFRGFAILAKDEALQEKQVGILLNLPINLDASRLAKHPLFGDAVLLKYFD